MTKLETKELKVTKVPSELNGISKGSKDQYSYQSIYNIREVRDKSRNKRTSVN